jgi:hypothetical protein
MKFRLALASVAAALSLCLSFLVGAAQTTAPPFPVPKQTKPAKPQSPAPPSSPNGQVIFSRSTDENGETTTQAGPAKAPQMAAAPTAEDAEREAVTFTDFDMDVHLRPEAHQIAVRALLTVRNDGKAALSRVPLQISSTLNWERIRVSGKDAGFQVATLNSDSDHTGQLREAAVPLGQPLPPGASVQLDVTYSGTIAASAQRLLAIGTPEDVALHSDWDRIDTEFTGLRGFGNVAWYPVSAAPVILGDGARLFDEMGEHKLRLSGARFRLHLTIEFPHGQAPTVALINGHPAELNITDSAGPGADIPGIATARLDGAALGFEAPSLFVSIRKGHAGTNLTAWTVPDNGVAVQSWITAATAVTPFLQGWLGQRPRAQLTLLDLPDPQDAPYETGALLATSLRDAAPEQLDGVLAHALTHAWVQSPRAWLSEGVAHFMGTLWIEKQQGREKALNALESGRPALALAEPESPGDSVGQPLTRAISPVYYRTKAAYVLWMLRDIASDPTLSAALRAYDPAQDANRGYGKENGPGIFETLLEQAGTRRDLSSFFTDWVDADMGLPDLTVESVFPSAQKAGNWLVAVNVANTGYAAAEVPVTVRNDATSVTLRVHVPARGKAVQRILIQSKPTEVQVNDGTVPESQASVHVTKLENAGASPTGSAVGGPTER